MESHNTGSIMSGFLTSYLSPCHKIPTSNVHIHAVHVSLMQLLEIISNHHNFLYNLFHSTRLFCLLCVFVSNQSVTHLNQLNERKGGKERKRRMNGSRTNACFVFHCTFIMGDIDLHLKGEEKQTNKLVLNTYMSE